MKAVYWRMIGYALVGGAILTALELVAVWVIRAGVRQP